MARNFKDVEYTKVDLDSPHRGFQPGDDNTLGLQEGEDDEIDSSSGVGGVAGSTSASGAKDGASTGDDESSDKKPSLLSMAYYQRFFNVDTRQVGMRILGSFVPRPGRNFVTDDIRHSPDLYGPFWVCTTLLFTVAIAGNIADYFQSSSQLKNYVWVYDFRKVTFAATAVYLYWWLVPLLLWALSWWRQLPERLTFLELLCLYGYSLAIYIPVSILCVIQVVVLQWILVLVGLILSGTVLGLSLWPSLSSGERKTGVALMSMAGVLHVALAVGFKLYFFYVVSSASIVSPSTANASSIATTSVTTSNKLVSSSTK